MTLRGDDSVSVTLEEPPLRIVTFSPAMTETVFALDEGDRIVGVSGEADDYPPDAREIEGVGTDPSSSEPDVEKVLDLDPDLVLAGPGGDEWKQRLRAGGVPVVTLVASDLPDALDDVAEIGRLIGAADAADDLIRFMRRTAGLFTRSVRDLPPSTCILELGYGPPIETVGPGSLQYDVLRRAGCDPITSSAKSPHPRWPLDAVVRKQPNAYVVSSGSARSNEIRSRPGFKALTAVRDGRVYVVSADLIERPGPRIVDGLAALARDLHPEAFG